MRFHLSITSTELFFTKFKTSFALREFIQLGLHCLPTTLADTKSFMLDSCILDECFAPIFSAWLDIAAHVVSNQKSKQHYKYLR